MNNNDYKEILMPEFEGMWEALYNERLSDSLSAEAKKIRMNLSVSLGIDEDSCTVLSWFISTPNCSASKSALLEEINIDYGNLNRTLSSLRYAGYIEEEGEILEEERYYKLEDRTTQKLLDEYNRSQRPLDLNGMRKEMKILSNRLSSCDSSEDLKSLIERLEVTVLNDRNKSFTPCKRLKELCGEISDDEAIGALIILAEQFMRKGCEPSSAFNDVTERETEGSECLVRGLGNLLTLGLAIAVNGEDDESTGTFYILSPFACGRLFKGMVELLNCTCFSSTAQFIRSKDIRKKELLFDSGESKSIETIKKIISPEYYTKIKETLFAKGRSKSINCLFYGDPGTGKTEFALQLAHMSGRDILIADTAKLSCKYVGESEKAYRSLFLNVKFLQAISDSAPILLFNEADSLLGRRINEERSIDKFNNVLQTILLQELEDFEGIFIATTNLEKNLDPAFDRRFIYKLPFHKPSAETRERIWKTMMPQLPAATIRTLASEFPFSGGQIDNVAKKIEIHEILNEQSPTDAEIMEFCRRESIGEDVTKKRTIINGF